jgi:hypothetical protein
MQTGGRVASTFKITLKEEAPALQRQNVGSCCLGIGNELMHPIEMLDKGNSSSKANKEYAQISRTKH